MASREALTNQTTCTARMRVFALVSAAFVSILATVDSAQAQKPEVVLRMGHVAPEQNIYHWASTHFAEKVAEYSNGEIRVDVFPSAQLGGDRDMLEGIQLGTLDAGYVSLAVFEGLTPVLTGFQMPFLIDSYETAQAGVTSNVAKEALGKLEEFGIKGLAIVENGFRVPGNTVRPIRTPKDFSGISFRAPEAPLQLEMFSLLGANVTPMPFPEVYTALQTGVLKGQDQILQTWVTTKAYEVVDYLSLTQMYTWPAVIALNSGRFDSLSESQRDALLRAAADTQAFTYNRLAKTDAEALEALKVKGLQIEENIDLRPFMELLSPLHDKYAKKDPIIAETIEFLRKAKGK